MSDSRVLSLSQKGLFPGVSRTHRAGLFIYELILDPVVINPSQKGSIPTDPTDVVCTGLFNLTSWFINPSQKGSVPTDPTDVVCTGLSNNPDLKSQTKQQQSVNVILCCARSLLMPTSGHQLLSSPNL